MHGVARFDSVNGQDSKRILARKALGKHSRSHFNLLPFLSISHTTIWLLMTALFNQTVANVKGIGSGGISVVYKTSPSPADAPVVVLSAKTLLHLLLSPHEGEATLKLPIPRRKRILIVLAAPFWKTDSADPAIFSTISINQIF